jgi:hypothetical protein
MWPPAGKRHHLFLAWRKTETKLFGHETERPQRNADSARRVPSGAQRQIAIQVTAQGYIGVDDYQIALDLLERLAVRPVNLRLLRDTAAHRLDGKRDAKTFYHRSYNCHHCCSSVGAR